jgi:predicted ATPase
MIERIQINGFKSIVEMQLELGRVNCFIGANGVGKSNILEAIGVLGAAANGKVDDESLLRRGVRPGVPRLYKTSFASQKTPVHIGFTASGSEELTAKRKTYHPEYQISLLNPLEQPQPAWNFKTERLSGEKELVADGVRNKKSLNPSMGMAALQLVTVSADDPVAKFMARLQQYVIYTPNTPTLRSLLSDPQAHRPLGLSGGSLADAFKKFKKDILDNDDEIADEIYGLIDWVSHIESAKEAGEILSPAVARSGDILKFTDRFMRKGSNKLSAHDASEGALYILFFAIICLSPQTPKFLAIDNMDQALNPRLIKSLTEKICRWLTRANSDRQILFTAHNPAVLDGLDLTHDQVRLFAVDRNSFGYTTIRRIQLSQELLKLNHEYPLSRLWMNGKLGAVPNV